MAQFIPLAIQGGSALYSAWQAHKQTKAIENQAGSTTPAETLYGTQGRKAATALQGQGQQLFKFGMPALQQSGRYFGDLLSGSRARMGQAVQPEAGMIRDLYRGASKNLERSNVRGAARDVAQADIGRESAGRIAGLIPGVRPQAASALASMGQYGTSAGVGATGQAGGIFADLLGGERKNRMDQATLSLLLSQLSQQQGSGFADLLMGLLRSWPGGGGGKTGGGGGTLASTDLSGYAPMPAGR